MKSTKKIFAIILVILALLITAKIAWGLNAVDITASTITNTPISISLSGVADTGKVIVSYALVNPANPVSNGTAALAGNVVTYTPAAGYFGPDSFTYTVTDNTTPVALTSAPATVNINVNGVPTANPQTIGINEDTAIPIVLTGSDPEAQALTYVMGSSPIRGTLTGTIPNLQYTPAANYFGTDSFTFTVRDVLGATNTAAVTINIASINDAPVATAQTVSATANTVSTIVLAGTDIDGNSISAYALAAQPAHGTATLAGNTVTYTPTADYVGTDSFTFTVTDNGAPASTSAAATITINVAAENHLKITNFKVNDKTSGKLKISSTNKVSATIGNDFDQTLEDVTVTIRILDVDGDDLEEEVASFNLNSGREKVVSADFDLSKDILDSDSYTVEIEATATGKTDDKDYDNTESKDFDVERSSHAVIIKKAELSNEQLTCDRETSLYVTVENIGKNDEDDVEITVKNSLLSLNKNKDSIELDDYSGTDTTYKAAFTLDLTGAKAGTYPLNVAVNLDGDLQETKEVSLVLGACATAGSSSTTANTYAGNTPLSTYLQQQLQQRAEAEKQAAAEPEVKSTTVGFRDSTAYTAILGTTVGLLIIAVILALAVLVF